MNDLEAPGKPCCKKEMVNRAVTRQQHVPSTLIGIQMHASIPRSLQGFMYSVTIRLGLNPSAKDRRWSSRKKLIFSRKIPRWILGGMPVHLHICRPRPLVAREIRSTYTCIIDSLPVLGMVQINNVGWTNLEQVSRKIRERPAKVQGACCKVPRLAGKRKW